MASKSNIFQQISSYQLSTTSVVILVFLLPTISAFDSSSKHSNMNSTDFIRTSCNATLYPDICYSSLSRYSNAIQQSPSQLARIAVKTSLSVAQQTANYIKQLIKNPTITNLISEKQPRTLGALHDCYGTLNEAVYQMKMSINQFYELNTSTVNGGGGGGGGGEGSFGYLMSNVQTWMSAALTNEDTCTDGFELVPNGLLKNCVIGRILSVEKLTSNALALVNGFVAYYEANNNGTTGTP